MSCFLTEQRNKRDCSRSNLRQQRHLVQQESYHNPTTNANERGCTSGNRRATTVAEYSQGVPLYITRGQGIPTQLLLAALPIDLHSRSSIQVLVRADAQS